MKYLVFVMALIVLAGSSCSHHRKVVVVNKRTTHKIPPGQAKKMTGAKSAKAYAPGQQKKH
jgi:hypothetical protein